MMQQKDHNEPSTNPSPYQTSADSAIDPNTSRLALEARTDTTTPVVALNQNTAETQQSLRGTKSATSYLSPSDTHNFTQLRFRCTIANSHLSQAELELRSLQIARTQVSLSLPPNEAPDRISQADKAVADNWWKSRRNDRRYWTSRRRSRSFGVEGTMEEVGRWRHLGLR